MSTDQEAISARLDEDGTVSFGGRTIGTWARCDDRFYRYKPLGSAVWTIQADMRPRLCSAITALSRASAMDG